MDNITDLQTLADEVGCEARAEVIGRRLFKSTECGIVFDEIDGGVSVCGYAEGADAECVPIQLLYPFVPKDFWEAVEFADEQGCELFEEWNSDEAET